MDTFIKKHGYYGTRNTHGYYTIENTWLPLEKYGD